MLKQYVELLYAKRHLYWRLTDINQSNSLSKTEDKCICIRVEGCICLKDEKNEHIIVATDQSRRRMSPHHKNVTNLYPARHIFFILLSHMDGVVIQSTDIRSLEYLNCLPRPAPIYQQRENHALFESPSIYIKMPTELEEVSFISHHTLTGMTTDPPPLAGGVSRLPESSNQANRYGSIDFLRETDSLTYVTAAANLTVFSSSQPTLFKRENLQPIKDLKVLVRDHPVCQ